MAALGTLLSVLGTRPTATLRPWFTHGPALSRDRSILHPLAECLELGSFIPVERGPSAKSFTALAAGGQRVPVLLARADLPSGSLDADQDWAWLGRKTPCGTDVFAVAVDEAAVLSAANPALRDVSCTPLRDVADEIPSPDDAALLSTARGYMHFHATNRFCARCGSPTLPTKAGAARLCTNEACRHKVYPRVDPAAIVLVTSPMSVDGGKHALLGRKKAWPQGRFSTLSGFAELGETIEEALCREVLEESGVVVKPGSLRFANSQPWLFPQSLMVGFVAEAEPSPAAPLALPTVAHDENELEACGWFSREYVAARLGGGGISLSADTSGTAAAEFHVPGRVSLAHTLITAWATEGLEPDEYS
ncbi:NUDIX hydrolase domain-like protein [Pavlovales sp. CCMP2436]|nr:NUDIX hydrolase domain-like protein [Pavlovales sp. CCMP2436]